MRQETLIIISVAVIAVAGGVVFLLPDFGNLSNAFPTAAPTQPAAAIVPFTRIAQGKESTVTKRVNYLIVSPVQMEKLWKMIDATSTPPTIDFKTHAVIAVFAGEEPTAGYAITVSRIEDSSERTVSVTLSKPGVSCMVGQSLTHPYEIVVVPTTSLPLGHKDISATTDCSN
jgi:hypothetical protein